MADNGSVRDRAFIRALGVCAALVALFALEPEPSSAFTAGPACGETLVKGDAGMSYRILFAKNGTVQRYIVAQNDSNNVETANDMLLKLEKQYGPAGTDAPPMHIVSFKPGEGGMMIPDKAVDSCGRTLSFQ